MVTLGDLARLVEEAEVGTLHVEADRGDGAAMRREGLEDAREQELDGAGLGGQARDAGDVEVRRLGAEQEVGIEQHRRLMAAQGVDTDRNAGRPLGAGVGVHAERQFHVGVGGEVHGTERHRLQRLLGDLAQHGGQEEAHLGAGRGLVRHHGRVAVGADDGVQRRRQVGVGHAVGDDAVHGAARMVDPHDRADPDRRLRRGPEVELVRGAGLELGGDDAADGR